MATLPGDPREDLKVTLGCDNLCGLDENGMLCINLFNDILHSSCINYTNANDINYCLGGTIMRQLFPRWLCQSTIPMMTRSLTRSEQHLIALR